MREQSSSLRELAVATAPDAWRWVVDARPSCGGPGPGHMVRLLVGHMRHRRRIARSKVTSSGRGPAPAPTRHTKREGAARASNEAAAPSPGNAEWVCPGWVETVGRVCFAGPGWPHCRPYVSSDGPRPGARPGAAGLRLESRARRAARLPVWRAMAARPLPRSACGGIRRSLRRARRALLGPDALWRRDQARWRPPIPLPPLPSDMVTHVHLVEGARLLVPWTTHAGAWPMAGSCSRRPRRAARGRTPPAGRRPRVVSTPGQVLLPVLVTRTTTFRRLTRKCRGVRRPLSAGSPTCTRSGAGSTRTRSSGARVGLGELL